MTQASGASSCRCSASALSASAQACASSASLRQFAAVDSKMAISVSSSDMAGPYFQRRDGSNAVDLRADCPREIADVLDAVSLARGISRTELVVEVLSKWADREVHAASIVARVAGRNPRYADSFGSANG